MGVGGILRNMWVHLALQLLSSLGSGHNSIQCIYVILTFQKKNNGCSSSSLSSFLTPHLLDRILSLSRCWPVNQRRSYREHLPSSNRYPSTNCSPRLYMRQASCMLWSTTTYEVSLFPEINWRNGYNSVEIILDFYQHNIYIWYMHLSLTWQPEWWVTNTIHISKLFASDKAA